MIDQWEWLERFQRGSHSEWTGGGIDPGGEPDPWTGGDTRRWKDADPVFPAGPWDPGSIPTGDFLSLFVC